MCIRQMAEKFVVICSEDGDQEDRINLASRSSPGDWWSWECGWRAGRISAVGLLDIVDL